MGKAFAKVPEDRCSIPRRVIPKTQEVVLDIFMLNPQY